MTASGKLPTLPLLVEIGCEEIPARFLSAAQADFGRGLINALEQTFYREKAQPRIDLERLRFSSEHFSLATYSTPRRLVAHVPAIPEQQADQVEEIVGPPVKVAFDGAGKPTRAAESFAAKNNAEIGSLVKVSTPKGEYVSLKKTTRGRPALDLLPGILTEALNALSFPKSMYWLAKTGPRFVRPIRWILALLGEGKQARVVPFEFAGVKSGNQTYGNRAASKDPITVQGFEDYAKKLRLAQVEFVPAQRRDWLMYEIQQLLEPFGARVVEDPWLRDWTVNSTEWPKPILGMFDEQYLRLPREVLVTVMRDHQKYFAVEDEQGNIQPLFIPVLNRDQDECGLIRAGHERVLAARFADAEFFWAADQQITLDARQEILPRVTYQAELGSYADKVERMRQIARELVRQLSEADAIQHGDAEHALRALALAKCDLTTQMVGEFPELQGIVGGLYARAQGEPEEVAAAIYDHYKPEGLEDTSPRTVAGAIVSLADKIDAVASGFAVGHEPTGSSDPFGLRRSGNGIVKVLVEFSFPVSVSGLVEEALNSLNVDWSRPRHEVHRAVLDFLGERLRHYLETVCRLPYDTVRAALAAGWDNPGDALRRAEALQAIRGSADLEALSVAAKRIKNILAKSASAEDWTPGEVDAARLEAGPERELYAAYEAAASEVRQLAGSGDYTAALGKIATLRPAVDLFFDKVLVMAEDRAVRENRLRLLGKLDALLSGIAQFSEIGAAPGNVDASTSSR
jgi:glycyl-tRNA synthetase beta chain